VYETADGYIGIAALNRKQRHTLCEVIGITDDDANVELGNISDDVYFHQKEVMKKIETQLKQKSNKEWITALEGAGVPCGPVNYQTDLFYDKQAEAMNMIWQLENMGIGAYKTAGHPVRFLKTPARPRKGSPTLGEHTHDVLRQFGFNKSEIEALKKSGVLKSGN
jgi:crotonobetainyl-CoA:carnitine CoA-transferase CaiB-like acyl-CoA transferase